MIAQLQARHHVTIVIQCSHQHSLNMVVGLPPDGKDFLTFDL